MIKQKIINEIKKILKKIYSQDFEIDLFLPNNQKFGDYTTNIALKLEKVLKDNSLKIAYLIKDNFETVLEIEKIEVIKPGFINFWLSKDCLIKKAFDLIDNILPNRLEKNQKILLEFGQPNTHKIPHIGHLFSYIYGESLARILEALGNKIYRVNYQGDIGLHVAKCLYQIKTQLANWRTKIKDLKTLKERVDFLQKSYQEGAKKYEENPKIKKEIDQLNIQIYQQNKEIYDLWKETRQWSLDFYQDFERKLGIKYDRCYFESETAPIGKEIVLENLNKVFIKSQGAIIFPGEKYQLHNRVFINKYNNPTYEAKDLGLFFLKSKDYQFDQSIVTTANEQNEYWRVVIKVCEIIFPEFAGKIKHIGFGMINLTTGKMSSRTGNIIDPFNLIETVKNSIKNNFQINDEQLIEKIAFAAIKYSFLNSDYRKNIVFDLEKSIAKEGNSGPYLLYTYVRAQSVLKKSMIDLKKNLVSQNQKDLEKEELDLLRFFNQFSEAIEKAGKTFNPGLVANYLYNLAKKYNLFYQKYSILKAEKEKKEIRILITKTTANIIKKGLELLGIETVERM